MLYLEIYKYEYRTAFIKIYVKTYIYFYYSRGTDIRLPQFTPSSRLATSKYNLVIILLLLQNKFCYVKCIIRINFSYCRHKWEVSAQDIDIDDFSSLESPRLQYASWLPSSAKSSHSGSAIVFVENYSIYYIPDVGKYEKREIFPISSSEEVTDAVIHGIPDWIYEGK